VFEAVFIFMDAEIVEGRSGRSLSMAVGPVNVTLE
jgi:hypothetical protein